ncbi:MAG: spore cortex biosynthesis protein YabQ [Thermoanaerobacteraceae bacterium]|jgi:spore cortex biosynthesis protein YabQ|nr:spore cortex biosynthesis protein YabQ [Thermoanaerobacteraceae bacterium]
MVITVKSQLYAFFVTFYGGIAIAFIYDIYRIIRIIVKPKKIISNIGDIIFWIIGTIIMIYFLYISNYVELRLFNFLGFFIGALLYDIALSPFIIKLLLKAYKIIIKILIRLYNTTVYPIKMILKILHIPYKFLTKIFLIPSEFFKNISLHFNFFKKKK